MPMMKKLAQLLGPFFITGDLKKGLAELSPKLRNLVLDRTFLTSLGIPFIFVDCAVRRFITPLVSSEYRIKIEGVPFSNDRRLGPYGPNGKIYSKPGMKKPCSTDAECKKDPKTCNQDPKTCLHKACDLPGDLIFEFPHLLNPNIFSLPLFSSLTSSHIFSHHLSTSLL